MELPFPPASFDLITLNGVFEYIGLWGTDNPKKLQEEFLVRALRMLRPGGYLYVGIETRFAAYGIYGPPRSLRAALTSLMPRWSRTCYCRLRANPFYGSEHVVNRYRTYTYTPLQYRSMVRRAGFETVSVQGVFDGYNRQRVLYDIDNYSGRKAVLERINPPASRMGEMRRIATDNRFAYRTLEEEVVIFAQAKDESTDPVMPWAEVSGGQRSVVQVSLPTKILGIVCDAGAPSEVLEVEKAGNTLAGARLEKSFQLLQRLQTLVDSKSPLEMRWPAPKGVIRISGREFRRYEYVAGQSFSSMLLPPAYDEGRFSALVSRAMSAYTNLFLTIGGTAARQESKADWEALAERLEGTPMGDDIRDDYRAALDAARIHGWTLGAIHGDFTAGNLFLTPQDELVLIDWEHFTDRFPIGADLVRFRNDVISESARLPPDTRQKLELHVHHTLLGALKACGYQAEDFKHLDALYVAHQIASLGGEANAFGPLLDAYRRRRHAPVLMSTGA